MLQFFGCLGLFILGILLFAVAAFGSLIDSILVFLGLKKRSSRPSGFGFHTGGFGQTADGFSNTGQQKKTGTEYRSSDSSSSSRNERPSRGQQTHKIFEKDESEYVEFEEV